jgi:hypothetical protein
LRRDVRGSDRHELAVREPGAAAWFQVVLFGCAALWLRRGSLGGSSQARRPWLPALLHTLMAGAIIWCSPQYLPLPGRRQPARPRRDGGHVPGRHTRPRARRQHPARGVLRGRIHPVAGARHRPGPQVKDPVSASQAAMSAGMAAMLFAML